MPEIHEGVRRAGPADAQRFIELTWAFFQGLLHHRGGELLLPPTEAIFELDRFSELIADPDRLVLMGTIDDAPVATALAHVEAFTDGREIASFDGIYVEDQGRSVGLGHLLAEAVEAWARARGCIGIDGRALPGDRGAKSFFESNGYKARYIMMHRELG
ncbi:MAG: GNAT family N-acetyltransferase [Actinomycetota bacterium]|nr:GNAT family N-acetyltransferase [Actinomycetota bacterium]